ncbi:hypothetical protein IWX49DRAFT_438098 [Phyllosticta citricarpa]|uniref:Uncharacterized protein n=2 Tax=Phyllosticta TaxID=121621 RepID=A0ABR1M3K5_9PEZI
MLNRTRGPGQEPSRMHHQPQQLLGPSRHWPRLSLTTGWPLFPLSFPSCGVARRIFTPPCGFCSQPLPTPPPDSAAHLTSTVLTLPLAVGVPLGAWRGAARGRRNKSRGARTTQAWFQPHPHCPVACSRRCVVGVCEGSRWLAWVRRDRQTWEVVMMRESMDRTS